MNLNNDFKEFIELLNANSVRYLVVGGYAVSFHGHPRYTKDIDIWIENEDANADRILKSLDEFGFGSIGIEKEDLLLEDRILQLGYPPTNLSHAGFWAQVAINTSINSLSLSSSPQRSS